MRKRGLMIISVILFLSLVVTGVSPITAEVYAPLLEVDVKQYHLTAGDENEIVVSIKNVGEWTAYDVKACLTVPSTVSGIAIVSESCRVFNEIKRQETRSMYPVLYVASSCPLGAYLLTFELEYEFWGRTYAESMQIGVIVDAIKPTKFILDVDVEDYNVVAGAENGISVILTNIGEEVVYDVEAVLTSASPGIVVLNESSYLFDKIYTGERINFRPVLGISRSVALGAYSLTLSLEYRDSKGVTYRDNITMGIFVDSVLSRRLTFKAEVEDYNVTAGTENKIKVILTNTGNTPVYDVDARLTSGSPQIAILKDISYTFDRIEPNYAVYFMPTVSVSRDVPLGSYSLTLTLKYRDLDGISYSDSLVVGLFVNSVLSPRLTFKAEVERYRITAGTENEIKVVLTNTGDTSVYDVDVQLSSASPQIVALKGISHTFDVIKPNCSVQFMPTLGVSGNTPLGAYSLTLTLKYRDPDGVSRVDSLVIGVFVDSVLSYRLTFKAEVKGYRVSAGTENEIEVALTNTGDMPVYDVDARLSSTSPNLIILKEISSTFGVIEPDSSVHFTPILGVSKGTPPGSYSLTLMLKYKDPDGVSHTDDLVIGIFVESVEPTDRTRIVVEGFQVIPSDAHPGDNLIMKMNLKNLGADAHDIQIGLMIDPQTPIVSLGPTQIFVGDLGPNQNAKIVYNLHVTGDAKAQSYLLQLAISYYDVYDQLNSITETVSISVHSIINFRLINIQPSSLTLEPGEMSTIEADLLLIGTETVNFVEVEILENHLFVSMPESYEYIGRVDPDSPVPFDAQFMVDPNATPGNCTLQMRVSYWDEYNQERQEITELPVVIEERVEQREEAALTFWDLIWRMIRILLGVKP